MKVHLNVSTKCLNFESGEKLCANAAGKGSCPGKF